MPTTYNTINYYVAADGTLRDGAQGEIPQRPQLNYGTSYAVTLAFPAGTIAEGDKLQVAINRTRTFFSSASATGDAPVAAVAKHDVTAEEAAAQAVTLTLSTATRAMIDQVNGIDHPVRGFFGVHVLRGQSFVTLAVADALMMSLESGPDAISPSLPVVDYPTREEAVAYVERSETAAGNAEEAQGKAEEAEANAQIWAEGTDAQVEAIGGEHSAKEYARLAEVSETNAGQSATDAGEAKTAAETAQGKAEDAQEAAENAQSNAAKIAEGSDVDVAPLGLEHSAKGWANVAEATLDGKRDILQTLVSSSSTALEAEAGKSYMWTVSAASTISMAVADKVAGKETRIDVYVDLQSGGSVAGSGVTIADAVLQSGWYKLIWDGTTATLYSTKAGGAESYIVIPAATTAYALADNKHYQQIPDAVPTYTLPAVTADGLVHEITILVDFLRVTSCAFVDAGGTPVTLQAAISPVLGSAYVFRCYWYGKWRIVPTLIRSAATVTSSSGALSVGDAVAGNALALRMVAPRSVVVNQLIQNGNFSDGYTNWESNRIASKSIDNNVLTCILGEPAPSVYLYQNHNFVVGHTYIVHITHTALYANKLRVTIANNATTVTTSSKSTVVGVNDVFYILTPASVADRVFFYPLDNGVGSYVKGDSISFSNMMCVDLTQYFNGDTTLIDSITSWDDLVAYDPRFAQYVAYNAGTVTGVQPTVKVIGKNLLDANAMFADRTPYTVNQDGTVTAVGNDGDAWNIIIPRYGLLLPAGDYTLSLSSSCFREIKAIAVGDSTNTVFTITSATGTVRSFTLNSPCKICVKLLTEGTFSIQLELGSTATAYEPYHDGGYAQAPAPLFAVGSAADEFEAVAGVTNHRIGSYTFTGNETPTAWRQVTGFYSCSFPASMIPDMTRGSNTVMFAFLQTVSYTIIYNIESPVACVSSGIPITASYSLFFRVPNSIATSGSELMQWLAGKTVYYIKATPTTSSSTPAQISLQAGNNVAMQTDGGRTLAELAMTYENLPEGE